MKTKAWLKVNFDEWKLSDRLNLIQAITNGEEFDFFGEIEFLKIKPPKGGSKEESVI